ncbi:AI-2E family transporter [Pseudomonas panipatensis]|uniref:Predicted PurR-regulated permease PerM n=1 Tax=Pseudomonas panipatensis TaxID=428992 RepID=A0A1G8F4H2_9PSED|nr:AI-2E family transporter [Pseudomonas panipatensis]SDH77031.1 Predicted PurR-regulated permease PerM [Pseudomonas panipatensis]SMP55452.1 Predicted PurR-regulated permease PerM [Pseudomonas panipatensis]
MFDNLLLRILLLILLGAGLWVLAPFWSALFWAAVLAFASWPLMRWLTRLLGGREALAAGLLTALWIVLVALPLLWLGFSVVDQLRAGVELIKNLQVSGLPPPPTWLARTPLIGDRLIGWWYSADQQGVAFFASLKPYMGEMGNWVLARSAKVAAGMFELVLSLVLIFFFYRDGLRLERFALQMLERLIGGRAEHYMGLIAGTVQRVVNGVIGTAAAQAVLACIGFLIAGVPGALLLGLLTFACSLLMFPPLIWGPATAWLFFQGNYGYGVFLGIWGFFVISGVDNILKPYLISRGGNLPLVVVLLGVLGGLLSFGFIGLFLGPVLLAVVYNLVTDWIESPKRLQPPGGQDGGPRQG